jgi:hypothetical protein
MARSLNDPNGQKKKIFFNSDNKLGRHQINLYFLFYLVCNIMYYGMGLVGTILPINPSRPVG